MSYLVVYRKATSHAGTKGDIVMKTGDGVSWSDLSTIYSDAALDARDACVTKLSDGSLIVSFLMGVAATQAPIVHGVYVIKSDDNGTTWGDPVCITDGFTNHSACCSPVIELADHTLLLAYYGKDTGNTFRSIRLMTSADMGATWANETVVANGQTDSKDYSEPNLLLLAGGNVICLIRTGTNAIYRTVSTDSGATWSAAASVIAGTGAPHVIQLTNGKLLCCYRSNTNSRTAMRTSADSGATWTNEFIFDTSTYVGMMYACPIQNAAGNVAVAYAVEISGEAHVLFKNYTLVGLP